jgi:hypothetical protein
LRVPSAGRDALAVVWAIACVPLSVFPFYKMLTYLLRSYTPLPALSNPSVPSDWIEAVMAFSQGPGRPLVMAGLITALGTVLMAVFSSRGKWWSYTCFGVVGLALTIVGGAGGLGVIAALLVSLSSIGACLGALLCAAWLASLPARHICASCRAFTQTILAVAPAGISLALSIPLMLGPRAFLSVAGFGASLVLPYVALPALMGLSVWQFRRLRGMRGGVVTVACAAVCGLAANAIEVGAPGGVWGVMRLATACMSSLVVVALVSGHLGRLVISDD